MGPTLTRQSDGSFRATDIWSPADWQRMKTEADGVPPPSPPAPPPPSPPPSPPPAPGTLPFVVVREFTGTAIQQAIDATTVPAMIILPKGRYIVNAPINFKPCRIMGEGQDASIFQAANGTIDLLNINCASVCLEHVGFQSSVTRTGGAYVNIGAGAYDFTLSDFNMTGAFHAFKMANAARTVITRGSIRNTAVGGGGFWITGGNQTWLSYILMDGLADKKPLFGCKVSNTGEVQIGPSVDLINIIDGLHITGGASVVSFNSYFDHCVRGVRIHPTDAAVERVWFNNCYTCSSVEDGVIIQAGTFPADSIGFVGHESSINGKDGFNFQAGLNLRINASSAYLNRGAGARIGMVGKPGITGVVNGNWFGQTLHPGNAAGMVFAGTGHKLCISGNGLIGNAGGPMQGWQAAFGVEMANLK